MMTVLIALYLQNVQLFIETLKLLVAYRWSSVIFLLPIFSINSLGNLLWRQYRVICSYFLQ